MGTPLRPWDTHKLENNNKILKSSQLPTSGPGSSQGISRPVPPPRPNTMAHSNSYSSGYSPYSSYGNSYMGSPYSSYGSLGWPGRTSFYGGGAYGGYGMYGSPYGGGYYGGNNDTERRFIQFAEDSSRNAFANVEAFVRAFNGISMMLDSTFFAMTSSFQAILGVAENMGRLRATFGQIMQAVSIFRLYRWLMNKLRTFLGKPAIQSSTRLAWDEAIQGVTSEIQGSNPTTGSGWPTLAFLGVILSAPYFLSKLLPKYEDKCDPSKWASSGIPAKAVFDFAATANNELSLHTNDEILLAPKAIQEEMRLTNSGWAYATCNGRSGVVPLNYIVVMKKVAPNAEPTVAPYTNHNLSSTAANPEEQSPVSSVPTTPTPTRKKRVSFGETQTQIYEPPEPPSHLQNHNLESTAKESQSQNESIEDDADSQKEDECKSNNS